MDIVHLSNFKVQNAKRLDLLLFQEIVATSLVGFNPKLVDSQDVTRSKGGFTLWLKKRQSWGQLKKGAVSATNKIVQRTYCGGGGLIGHPNR